MLRILIAATLITGLPAAAQSQPSCKPGTPGCAAPATNAPSSLKMDRDTQRKADVNSLKVALEAYAKKNGGSFAVKGAGADGLGLGWVSVPYGAFPSIAAALTSQGFLKSRIADKVEAPDYMIYLCDNNRRYSISATLDRPSTAEIAQAQTTCQATGPNGTFTTYKKNYAVGN